jgi:hypothetical protein
MNRLNETEREQINYIKGYLDGLPRSNVWVIAAKFAWTAYFLGRTEGSINEMIDLLNTILTGKKK